MACTGGRRAHRGRLGCVETRPRGNPRVARACVTHTFRGLRSGPPGPATSHPSAAEVQMRRFRSTVASVTPVALALQCPLAARAADTASSDPVAQRCDRFAAPLLDAAYGGPREPITAANREEALQACRQAASAQ